MLATGYDNWVGLGVAVVVTVLLLLLLIVPERF